MSFSRVARERERPDSVRGVSRGRPGTGWAGSRSGILTRWKRRKGPKISERLTVSSRVENAGLAVSKSAKC